MKKIKDRRVPLGITIPESLSKKLDKIEETEMINKSKLIEKLLKNYLDNQK